MKLFRSQLYVGILKESSREQWGGQDACRFAHWKHDAVLAQKIQMFPRGNLLHLYVILPPLTEPLRRDSTTQSLPELRTCSPLHAPALVESDAMDQDDK